MISLNVKQWRSEDQTKLDQFVSCACTCHRTDVEDKKYKAICMTCNCAFDNGDQKEKESRQRKRKE